MAGYRPIVCSSSSGLASEGAVWFFRGAFLVVPVIAYAVTKLVCAGLAREQAHPLRGWSGHVVIRNRKAGGSLTLTGQFIELDTAER